MEVNLLDRILTDYQDRKVPVTIVLQNRIRITGKIRSFDSYVVLLENQKNEIVYRHAISSLTDAAVPVQPKAAPRRQPEQARPAAQQPPKVAAGAGRHKPAPPARPASTPDASINTGMKEGLLRWMQGQKASK